MNISKRFKIIGTGQYLPAKIITSKDLEIQLGLPAGWSYKFSGVRERRHAENENNAEMAANAINQAIQKADISISSIDLLISSSATFDYILPFQAALILRMLGQNSGLNIPAMDVGSSCLSFVSAMNVAASLLDGNNYKRIAIVSSEISSIGLNPGNKEIYTLFGDGAAAAILEWDDKYDGGMIKSSMKTYPEGFYYSIIKGGGNSYWFKDHPYDPNIFSFSMEGKKLLKLAKQTLPQYFSDFFSDLDSELEDIDVIIPHQASKAGMMIFQTLFPDMKGIVYSNLETLGNCISASIPLCLHETIEKGMLKRGDYCLFAGTAAGFAIGGILFKY
jgi:3-oxoacyl-[acyl-carrier-protein] synthase-3